MADHRSDDYESDFDDIFRRKDYEVVQLAKLVDAINKANSDSVTAIVEGESGIPEKETVMKLRKIIAELNEVRASGQIELAIKELNDICGALEY